MAVASKQDGKNKRPRPSGTGRDGDEARPKPQHDQPRAAPSFVSTLQHEETDFPRGGGTSLTALEVKQTRAEGRREAEAEAAQGQGVKRRRQISDREAKRLKKNEVDDKRKERDKDNIRVEELNYKRLVTGTRLLTRIHTVLPLHLVLSLPNNLLAHVPITEISTTLTTLLHKEEASSTGSNEDEDEDDEESGAPDLATLFSPGQYFPAKVLNLFPTASQSFISQYPVSETTRLAARVEMTLMPEKVNSEVVKADLNSGFALTGEVLGEEDKGWRVGLGLAEEVGGEGWISREEVDKHMPTKTLITGQLVPATITGSTAGGRIIQLSLDHSLYTKTSLSEVSNIASILPGQLVAALITAVVPSGLNLKICGFFDGTIDLAHLNLKGEDIDEKYKIGKKIKARVLYDNLNLSPKRFGLSLMPHLLELSSPVTPDGKTALEIGVPIGKMLSSVKITRVIQEWGVMCRTDDGLEGFVHISHISDERIPALSGTAGPFRIDTLHRARVIGHSPLDGILLLSFEQKVLDQVFMQVDELKVGQHLKGTIRKLGDKGLFVNIAGSVDGVVWPNHYADIKLKHPEKRFKIGGSVKARVFALEPARSRVVLTLKKSLVDSELEVPEHFGQVQTGMITPAVVSKILDKGCIVDLFGGLRAFVPQSEASQNFIVNLKDIFFEGKPVNVRITEVNSETQRLVASVRQALPTALAASSLSVMDEVSGVVSQVHADQVVMTLIPSQITALLSLANLSNHRHIGVEELRAQLKVGERLDELVVISKNDQSGLVILSNKRAPTAPATRVKAKTEDVPVGSGISTGAKTFDSFKPGVLVRGKVISHTPQGSMVQLANHVRGRVHPTDAADDLEIVSKGDGPLNIGEEVECYILTANPATRIIDLSTRPSRVSGAGEVVDPELAKIVDVKAGMKVRGLVKNVSGHGVFVALGRAVTARVMIKELFDEFVKDWESKFEVNQLVSGTITSVNESKKLVEMSLRKEPGGKRTKESAKKGLSEFTDGQVVDATVKKVEEYGMFLQIEGSNVSGLCHKSQISDDKTKDVSKALQGFRVGDRVKAVLSSIDTEKARVNFSIKPSLFGDAAVEGGDDDEEMDDDEDEEDDDEEMENGEETDEEEDDDENGDDDEDDDEELASGEELDFENGSDDEDEESDDDEADVTLDLKTPVAPKLKTKTKAAKNIPTLSVTGGFDWTGEAPLGAESDSSDSDSDADSDAAAESSSKSKTKKSRAKRNADLTASAPSDQPSSALEFERALLASPNSSFLWIQYMSFLLQLHEVDKARAIGRKALDKIALREETEKLNVWMALVNLEIGFGTTESREKVWKEAAEYNDKRTVWARYAEALVAAGKQAAAEEVWRKYVKKFSQVGDSWTKAAEFWFKAGDVDEARDLLPRSMKSLDKSHHIETIKNFAVLEFRHADAERGKTLFEELVDRYPKRLDIVSVYMDQLVRVEDISGVRGLVDRALAHKLNAKKAKFLFKKLLQIESKIGDKKGEERAKDKAREWVMANAAAGGEDDE